MYKRISETLDLKSSSWVLLGVLLVALALRLNGLGDHSVWIDEAGTSSLVETFLNYGIPEYPSGEESYRSMPHILVTSLSAYIFGMSDFALRLPSVIFGLSSITLVFKWSEELFDLKSASLASGLLSVSSWHIAMSQNARMYAMFSFLYLSTFYLLFRYEKTGRPRYLLLTGFLTVSTLLTHVTGYILLFTIPLYLILNTEKISIRTFSVAAIFGGITTAVSEYLYLDVKWLVYDLKYSMGDSLQHLIWLSKNEYIISYAGLTGILMTLFERRDLFKMFFFALIPPLTAYMFFVELKASRYIFFMMPFLAVMSGYFLFYLKNHYVSNDRKIMYPLLVFLLVATAVSGNPLDPQLGSHAPQADYKTVYNEIEQHRSDEDILIVGRPLPAAHYLRNPDYILFKRSNNRDLISNGTEYYSGSPTIENRTELNKVLGNHESGWIVATEIVQRNIDPDLTDELDNQRLALDEKNIKLWRIE